MAVALLGALAAVALAGCADAVDADRPAWLHAALVQANRPLAERDPDQTAQTYRKMAATPHGFFRATLPIFLADARQPGPGLWPTAFADGAATQVLALGDPHLENLGTVANLDGVHSLEVNDFDGATFGPFHLDVRRLALGLHVAAAQVGLDAADQAALVRAALTAYVAELQAEAAGQPPARITAGAGAGVIVDDLIRRARRDGEAREALTDYTELVDGARRLRLGDIEAPIDDVVADTLVPLTPAEQALTDAVLAQWPASLARPAAFALKDAARRLGAGVSSFPVLRIYALVEGPTAADDDDWLIEVKELPDPAAYAPVTPWPSRPFADNAQRAALVQRTWQGQAEADPLLGHVTVAPMAFRIRHRTKHQKGVDLGRIAEKLAEGDWTPADVTALGAVAGRLLARGHGQSPTLRSPDPAAPHLARLLGDGQAFIAETEAALAAYAPAFDADTARFAELLRRHGPLLGYRRARDQVGLPPRAPAPVSCCSANEPAQ